MNLLESNLGQLRQLCDHHKVKSLYAFGSVLTDKFDSNSDIDLLVDFDNMDVKIYADNYFDLKFSLEELLKRPVDLLEEKALKNTYFKQAISAQKKFLYGH